MRMMHAIGGGEHFFSLHDSTELTSQTGLRSFLRHDLRGPQKIEDRFSARKMGLNPTACLQIQTYSRLVDANKPGEGEN